MKKHKREEFRIAIANAEQSSKKLFGSAKWARGLIAGTLTQATVLPLKGRDSIAITAEEKAKVMFKEHFLPPPTVDTSDIENFRYPEPIEEDGPITEREIQRAVNNAAPDKAPGPNGYTNRALRQLVSVAPAQVRSLFERYIQEGIQPSHFKRAATIVLRKPGKKDYSTPSAFRPIALLDTLGKILESIVSERIRYAVEKYKTLPDT